MKRFIACILILVTILTIACPTYAVEPRYTNANSLTLAFDIGNSGKAAIDVRMYGNTALTQAKIVTYIELKVGTTWTRVSVGATGNSWQDTTTNSTFAKTYTAQLGSRGEYRAVTVFTLTASTVETIVKTSSTVTY